MTPTLLLRSNLKCRVFIVLFGILAVFDQNAFAQACSGIRGKAFSDYNYNGLDDDIGSVGVGGIEVKLCDGSGVVGSAITAADGSYAFPAATNGSAYRIEFKIPVALSLYKFSATGLKSSIATQFVIASNCTVNVAVAVPADYCQANPFLIAPIYVNGDPLIAAGSAKDSTTLLAIPYDVPTGTDYLQQSKLLKTAQIGSTWGVAFQRSRKIIVSTATLKRHVGFGPQGTGGIYFTDFSDPMNPSVLGSLSLATAGIDPRVTDGVPLPSDPTLPSNDVTAYAKVGKMSLGGATISDDDKTLYTINLQTNELVKIDMTALKNDGVTLPTAANVTTVALPAPCGASGAFRPWAVKYWHGKLYIGGVCSAETSKMAADLSASVYCYDGTNFSLIKSFPLDYIRGIVKGNSPTFNKWLPWEDDYTLMLQNGQIDFLYPQPILSDIEFDTDGSMILGFTDRMGSQSAFRNYVPRAAFPFVLANGVTGGDIMRLCLRSGVYQVENTPAAGCSTTGGATDGQGPNGGEYYWSDYWTYGFLSDENPPTAFPFPFHNEIAQGGLTMIAGKGQVVSTVHDPISEAQTGGFTWFDNTTGKRPRSYEAFISTNATFQNRGYSGQANGLGDVHAACDPAPICIGNRVWADCNANGQQDAEEVGISGVTVTLTASDCSSPRTTVTDKDGNYEFCGLAENTDYYLRFGATGSFDFASQKLTVGGIPYTISPLDFGLGTNPDENDSDAELPNAGAGVCENDLPFIRVRTLGAGCTQNNYDIGLVTPRLTTLTAATTPTSCSGEIDGTITITAVYTPVTAIEYSKDDGVTWQASNVFTNLETRLYNLKVRIAGSTAVNTCTGETLTATVVAGAKINPPVTTADDICWYELTSRLNGMTAACDACPGALLPKITWWTAAVGGIKVGEGSPFSPVRLAVGAAGYVDPAVEGTTVFYAQCECGTRCVSDRTATNFTVFPRPLPVVSGELFPCPASTVTYTTPSVVGSSWVWSLPSGGGTIVSSSDNSVTIRWTNTAGAGPFDVRVVETNANNCSHGTNLAVSTKQTNMACVGSLNVSVDHNCQVTLTTDNILGRRVIGGSTFKIQITHASGQVLYEGTGSVTIDAGMYNLLGRTVQYRVTESCSGNSCWGNILFEDKTPPRLTCPDNVTVSCAQMIDGTILPSVTGQPTVGDCSGTTQSYNDVTRITNCQTPFTALPADLTAIYPATFPTTGDIVQIILREFSVKDYYNNVGHCYQYIFVRRSNLANIVAPPSTIEVSCTNFTGTIDPSVSGYPLLDVDGDFTTTFDRLTIMQSACRLTANYTDQTFTVCGGSKKLVRTWTVYDDCASGGGSSKTCTQTIAITDKATPSVSAHFTQYQRVGDGLVGVDAVVNFNTAGVESVSGLSNSYNCGGKARFTIKGKDNGCVKSALTFRVNDSRVRLMAGYPQYNPTTYETIAMYELEVDRYDDYTITFSATNACQTVLLEKSFRVTVQDNASPNASCKGAQVSLNNIGTALVYAESINNSSTDNCGISRIEVRRMKVCGTANTNFAPYMEFSCCDVLDTIQVVLRVWDYAGNYTDCMTNVTVTDKMGPTCYPLPRRIINCADLNLNTLDTYGTPTFADNCGIKDTLYTVKEDLTNCRIGTITRKWVVSDRMGLKDSCQQVIEVKGQSDFTVDFPDDIVAGCFATVMTKEQARTAILSNPPTVDGHIINNGCGVLMVEVTDDTLTAVPDACYKILRKFTVIDWCKYNPNNTNLNQYGAGFGQPICGDVHGNPLWLTQNLAAWQSLSRPSCAVPEERRFRDADGLGGTGAYPDAFSDGVMRFTQIIKILDNTPPVILPYVADTVIKSASVDCIDNIRLSIKATDQCVGERVQNLDFVSYYWDATDVATNTVVKTGTTNDVLLENVPFGKTYRIGWRVHDRCGNLVFGTQFAKLVDVKAPALVCRDINAELARGTNGAWVVATLADLFMSTADNCTPRAFLESKLTMERTANSTNTYPSVINTSVTFDCLDAGKDVPIRLWTYDAANNANFCEVKVRVQDNLGACTLNPTASINGKITNDKNVDIANVVVTASSNGATIGTATSTTAGNFSFATGVSMGGDYAIRAEKTDGVLNGVTTLDIALMSKHVLDIQMLSNPYRIIAGDVNRDGELSGIDMLQTRRVILRVTPQFAGGKTWRFVDKRYIFDFPENPLAEDFPESVILTSIPAVAQANFIGIKIGDVSGNAWAGAQGNMPVVRGANKVQVLEVDDVKMEAGKEYTVKIRATDFIAQGLQFTLNSADGLDILKVLNGNLPDMSETNFGLFKNAVTLSWNGDFVEKTEDILTIVVRAKKNMDLSEALTIGSNLTNSEGFDAKGVLLDIKLSFKGQNNAENFALYQNQPNPFYEDTKIAFYLPSDSKAKLIVSDASGKVLKVIEGSYAKGYNEVPLTKTELNTSGIVFYRLETPTHTAARKMIIMQ
ncbi:MAG: SdrD B-like domain-containing protein [Saprospiraceae bacterium]|nr:SdrD B-like domain-containing protein [Saprospiraceae bacterium]